MSFRLDHIAFRVDDKSEVSALFYLLGYNVGEVIEIDFGESKAESYVLMGDNLTEVFASDSKDNQIVRDWVNKNGPGVHHLAFSTDTLDADVERFKFAGIEFTSDILVCDDLRQIFTKPQECLGGITIELIERKTKGFCAANVKKLMESTKPREDSPSYSFKDDELDHTWDYKRNSED